MKRLFIPVLCLMALVPSAHGQNDAVPAKKPNVVLILIDDSSLMDLGVFGGEAQTPNIDRLAGKGILFSNMHASPVCSPSRAMLLTGTDSHLAGVANLPEFLPKEYQGIDGYGGVLNDRVQTIATRLKEVNYSTYAVGKWHLGHEANTLPPSKGFDRSFVLGGSGASNYDNHGYLPMKPLAHWYADGIEVELPEDFYSSKAYIDQVISFHQAEKNKENPFFAYIAFQAIHAPIQAPKEYVEKYKEVYRKGWNKLREDRFFKAKELGFIPENTPVSDPLSDLKKWDALSAKEQDAYVMSMAVTAGMLEAMDHHVGRYIEYLTEQGMMENTIFIVTSDNGPDGADYKLSMPWALTHGYHRDYDAKGEKGYFGYLSPGWANGLSAPFSFFKYYTGEGGLRVPLIISGKGIPESKRTDAFCFFTDIAPTIYDWVGISTAAKEGFAPITGKSMWPHMQDFGRAIYEDNEGVGLEAAGSSAYFLNGFKIVKNNIPLGDNAWHLYDIANDPTESVDLSSDRPDVLQKMLAEYEAYERKVGVVAMPEGYSASGEVTKKSVKQILLNWLPWLAGLGVAITGFLLWRKNRRV